MAPMEGVTVCFQKGVYKAFCRWTSSLHLYYTAYEKGFSRSGVWNLIKEYNKGQNLIVQILTNSAGDFEAVR